MNTEDLFRHQCTVTGLGMDEGYYFNHNTYAEKEDFVKVLREEVSNFNLDISAGVCESYLGQGSLVTGFLPVTISDEDLLKFSYDNEYHYWTTWHQDNFDLEEEGEAFDKDGNKYYFDSKHKEWKMEVDEDEYEWYDGGDGVEYEIWKNTKTEKLIKVPIELKRYFEDAKPYN